MNTMPTPPADPVAASHGVSAVECVDLCKSFGALTAVDHLSLTVQQGEIFGLLGPNGSGKTTTVNMISGLSQPTSGTIRVLGDDIKTQLTRVRRRLGTVPQETALYDELTAWANLDFHADLFGVPTRQKRERIAAMLQLVQLQDRQHSRVGTFSGGMRRRLALARALLHDPELLYLDEPTLGVDVQSRRAIWDYIRELRERGKTVLLTTNYLEEAQQLCNRLAIIDHGKLIVLDTPAHLKQTYGGSVVEIETAQPTQAAATLRALPGVTSVTPEGNRLTIAVQSDGSTVPQIINLLAQEGPIRHLALREPTLDDVFLQLTGTALRD